jgi:hypothetical protein
MPENLRARRGNNLDLNQELRRPDSGAEPAAAP